MDDIDIRSLLLNPVQDLKLSKYEDVQMYQVMESYKLRVSSFAGKADKDYSIQVSGVLFEVKGLKENDPLT